MNIVDNLLKVALLGSAWVLYLLIALSIVSIAAMVERFLYFRRQDDPELREKLNRALLADDLAGAERTLKESGGIVGEVLVSALRFKGGGAEAVSDAVD
ncbi:MAG TPA: hypothetical protein VMF89_28465, partial [Polyangiales bacterium]|nr:hypothetical protein [Polyangiales bacterium]